LIRQLASLLFLSNVLLATETSPWFGNIYEIETRNGVAYQGYKKIDGLSGGASGDFDDFFMRSSVLISPVDRWSVEVELSLANTRQRGAGLESFLVTGRYLLLEDLFGDTVSLAVGVTAQFSPSTSVRDWSSYQSGRFESEGHISLGKEFSENGTWNWRVWTMLALGYAFEGNPFMRYEGVCAINVFDEQEVQLFLRGRLGFGTQPLNTSVVPFAGYGSVAYSLGDLGLRVGHSFGESGVLSVELARRMWAHHTPKQTTYIGVDYLYSFGL
jgi:hypothetical protein